ncbi:hypothetical protein AVEN_269985-1 [Araneus ventricosus]|uniref:Uncharacterized protein n=1 Tax=Araneus ventricosus TaxID=182803 RepID=A0A4Y2R2Y4_ARAVE|nr:hypothetical protein AVEN_269985-1 [Araneus ventricosus]
MSFFSRCVSEEEEGWEQSPALVIAVLARKSLHNFLLRIWLVMVDKALNEKSDGVPAAIPRYRKMCRHPA